MKRRLGPIHSGCGTVDELVTLAWLWEWSLEYGHWESTCVLWTWKRPSGAVVRRYCGNMRFWCCHYEQSSLFITGSQKCLYLVLASPLLSLVNNYVCNFYGQDLKVQPGRRGCPLQGPHNCMFAICRWCSSIGFIIFYIMKPIYSIYFFIFYW